jgi:two-component system sensor histidine kinase/response regulator
MDRRQTVPDERILDLERQLEETKRAAHALADSERLYRALFEGTATAVTVRSLEDQSFLSCNQAALALYRAASVDQLRTSRVTDLSAETQPDGTSSLEALRVHVAAAIRNGTERCEWAARRLDGSPFTADIRIAIVSLESGRRVMQTIVEDITERKAAQVALERRAQRDEIVGQISRRFLEEDVESAVRFAAKSVGAFLGVGVAEVTEWFAEKTRLDFPGDDAGLVRILRETVALARARDEAQNALRLEEERYRSLVERSHDAIITFDTGGTILFASPSAERLVGYSADEIVGKNASEFVVPEERPLAMERIRESRTQNEPSSVTWSLLRRDGSIVRVEAARSPIYDKNGAIIGAQSVLRDITERHHAQQMLEAVAVELDRAKEDALAASRAKSAFVANMSHELRTPLNGVIGMVDLLSGTNLDARQRRYVEVARSSASLLLSVINDILDFSKIEAGKLDLERIEFSFSDVVEEVATLMELSAEDKGLELSCQTEPELSPPLYGDPGRIRQVLVNLISNAVKFTRAGEVAVRAILAGEAGGHALVRVEVRDTGVGIPVDARQKLFHPFSQLDASTTRKHGGSGLGLAICRELVHRMGGEIGVEGAPDRGSMFWFTLRLERVDLGPPRISQVDARLAGLRVLAVDDNATNREVLRAQLAAAGTRCTVASSGEQALGLLASATEAGDAFPLAVLDQHMPEMDGLEVARRIKQDPRIAAVRIVMLGSIGRPLDTRQLKQLGVLTWATKPIWRAQLLRALTAALDETAIAPARPRESEAPPPPPPPSSGPAPRARILLVEDTPVSAEVVTEILRSAGYEVHLAADGLRAVDVARSGTFDLILMDCQLPGIDGYEATRRIRALESLGALSRSHSSRVPILALTASAALEDKERARLAGMDGHIAKPIDARRLLTAIAEHDGANVPDVQPDREARARVPVVDLVRALDRLMGNRELLARLVAQFREEAERARASFREAMARRDVDALGYAAHRLRGQALALDALELTRSLDGLEKALGEGDWAATEAAQRAMEVAMDVVLKALAGT